LRAAPKADFQVTRLLAQALVALLALALLGCAGPAPSLPDRKPEPPAVTEARAAPAPPVAPPVVATPKEEPQLMAERWAAAFSRGDLDALMSLYDEDALMWGTSSSTMRRGAVAIRQYYAQLLRAFPGTRISLGATSPRLYGDTGVNSGSYTVRRVSGDGKPRVTLARFTMTYVRRDGKWLIVDHHSSLAPR
jgi:uncharacterized protein (TIGR02246 family)